MVSEQSVKILLTGATGQLGRHLLPLLSRLGEVTPARRGDQRQVRSWAELDLADEASLNSTLVRFDPDLVVNAGAYTAVDQAEDDQQQAWAVNAQAPRFLGEWARSRDRAILHFSTDYVFSGQGQRPWREQDPTGPRSIYGRSKLAGEQALAASGCRYLVFRSSWIYAAHGRNFVRTMLQLARSGRPIRVVGDQVGSPTWAGNLARYAVAAIRAGWLARDDAPRTPAGGRRMVYHAADFGAVSWFGFADLLFDEAVDLGLLSERPSLTEVTSKEFPQKAARPAFSVLDSSALVSDLGVEQGELRTALRACLGELKNSTS